MIHLDDVSYHYPDGLTALDRISLHITKGERVALIGPNGAGKSTLLLQLNGLLQPTVGMVEVVGLPVEKPHLETIRAAVGFIFQNPDDQLFNLYVYDDVAYGPRQMDLPEDEVKRRVQAALATVNMSGFEKRISHHLSVGQKKRIALATVLSMDPQILVLDEPSAGLDPRARRNLIALLNRSLKTLIFATHDMRLTRDLATRVIILAQGQMVADGPTCSILHNEALLVTHGLEAP